VFPQFKGKKIECIHGDLNQRDRDRVFTNLRDGSIDMLVATDVVGRGIDVSTVSHIINFDIPMDCDDYVHRVGRTGRMGREGIAFTFVSADEGPQLTAIELNINKLLQRDSLDDAEAVPASTSGAPASRTDSSTAKPQENSHAFSVNAEPTESANGKRKRLFPKRKLSERLARLGRRD
jgi:ATP-dependent RNA helicase DeaD